MWYIDNLSVSFSAAPATGYLGKVYVRKETDPDDPLYYKLVSDAAVIHIDGSIPGIVINDLIDGVVYVVKIVVPSCGNFYKKFNSGTDTAISTSAATTTAAATTTGQSTTSVATTTAQGTTTVSPITTAAITTQAQTTEVMPSCSPLTFTNITANSFTANWVSLIGVNYMINLYDDAFSNTPIEDVLLGNVSEYNFTGLLPDTDYWVKLIPVKNTTINPSCGRAHTKTAVATTSATTTAAATTTATATTTAFVCPFMEDIKVSVEVEEL